jgi:hypothetical protein
MNEAEFKESPDMGHILPGNKTALDDRQTRDRDEATALTHIYAMLFFELAAKDAFSVSGCEYVSYGYMRSGFMTLSR